MKPLIVDTNVWPSVFSRSCSDHEQFKPVLDAILSGKRQLVWGGTHYKNELKKCGAYMKIHIELSKAGKARELSEEEIDRHVDIVRRKEQDRDFDDAHLVAIQIVSNADIIVTGDRRCHSFLKKKALYPKRHQRPKIYGSIRNQSLL